MSSPARLDDIQRILAVLKLAERLKSELRHSWLSSGRRESVAEHTWQMALMAVLMHRHLEHPVDLERTLAMITVHDLVEAIAGDVPFFETGERKAMKRPRAGRDRGDPRQPAGRYRRAGREPVARVRGPDHGRGQVRGRDRQSGGADPAQPGRPRDLAAARIRARLHQDGRALPHDGFLAAFCEAVKAECRGEAARGWGRSWRRSRRTPKWSPGSARAIRGIAYVPTEPTDDDHERVQEPHPGRAAAASRDADDGLRLFAQPCRRARSSRRSS